MVRRGLLGALFPFLIAGAAGCGSSSPTAPVADPTVVSDTFTGTINPLGTDSHTFTVGYAGGTSNASVTVMALATVANQTPQTITIGVGFGSLNQGVCTPALTIPARTTTSPESPRRTVGLNAVLMDLKGQTVNIPSTESRTKDGRGCDSVRRLVAGVQRSGGARSGCR